MFICTYAFIYHMYQSKGELHANVKLHFFILSIADMLLTDMIDIQIFLHLPIYITRLLGVYIMACQAHPALVKQVQCWPVF